MLQPPRDRSIVRLCGASVFAAVVAGLLVQPAAWNRPAGRRTGLPHQPGPDRVLVVLDVLGTPPDRATGTAGGTVRAVLAPGERKTWFVGADNGRTGNLCATGISVREPDDAAVRWRVDLEVVEASAARATLEVNWTRARLRAGVYSDEARDPRTVRFDLGEHQVLDYVADPASTACASVLLQLTADVAPVPEPQATLVFDLWLEYNGRLGHRWEHQQVTARSGVQAPFRFDSMGWAVGEDSAAEGPGPVRLDVTGTVLGRLRSDGFVDIALRAHRWVRWAGSGWGGVGELDYRAALGEAAGVLLPPPSGSVRSGLSPRGGSGAPGLSERDGVFVLDLKQFLDGAVTIHVEVHQ
jgi:hypothetical protein